MTTLARLNGLATIIGPRLNFSGEVYHCSCQMAVDSLDMVAVATPAVAEASGVVGELGAVVDPEKEVRGLGCLGQAD